MKAILLFIFLAPCAAELLDRVAVTVGNKVITQAEIMDEIRLNSFLNNEPPNFTAQARHDAADRLIEQKLVQREMELGRYPAASAAEADAVIEKLEKTRARSEGQFDRELKTAGITSRELRDHLLWGLTLSHFIDLRFRPAVQVTRQDVQQYYQTKILPSTKPGQQTSLADVRAQIEQTLTAERADKQMDAWLKDSRSHANVEFHNDAFAETPK